MYSNAFRCTLLCFWSTCTPHVLRVYSNGTLPTALKFPKIGHKSLKPQVTADMAWGGTRWAGLQYSTPTVLCVVLCVYSARTLGGVGTR